MVGVPLHHLDAVIEVLGLVVNPGDALFLVCQLSLNVLFWPPMLPQKCARGVSSAMTYKTTFVTNSGEHFVDGVFAYGRVLRADSGE